MKAKLPYDRSADPLKDATLVALEGVIDPLMELVIDAGVTVAELIKIIRNRAVRVATRRVRGQIGRNSNSRVSIMTGLPRSEISRILRPPEFRPTAIGTQHPARRVLEAWYRTPSFLASSGDPAEIPIFGKRRSFQYLVEHHGGGIPVRAMLDELIQMDAVVHLPEQRVRAKSRVPILRGLTPGAIKSIGERTRDLLETLTRNLRQVTHPLFEATAISNYTDRDMLTMIRREIAAQGANFIGGVDSLLTRSQSRGHRARDGSRCTNDKLCRVGVTVYYFQEIPQSGDELESKTSISRRRNLKRKRAIN